MSREPDENLRSALTATAHEFSGSGNPINEAICDALRGVVARASRYDAMASSPGNIFSSESASPMSSNKPVAGPCMTAECGKPRQWKGLCRSCYAQALRIIDQQETTWEELQEMGLCDLDHKPFTAAFFAKKQAAPQ